MNHSRRDTFVQGQVLIVDDDPLLCTFVRTVLESAGYEVQEARNGAEALAVAKAGNPDLIISDWMMPVMDGKAFCQALKNDPEFQDVFFVVLTAKTGVDDKVELLNCGADDFIPKPVGKNELLAKVQASMRFISLRKELRAQNEKLKALNEKLERTNKELGEAQAQLLQREKMASIGQLAAGVAHEINNPIGFINSNLGTLAEYVEDMLSVLKAYEELEARVQSTSDPTLRSHLQRIQQIKSDAGLDFILADARKVIEECMEGATRVKAIVKDLKDFSHVDQAELKHFNVNHGLESTLNIVWNELKYKANVIRQYGDVPEILCYPMQLNQVFMNILVNAAQAIPDRGEIGIQTFSEHGKVYVKIWDTGVGIPEENLTRIFDPFFTTKEVGKGTGLGLSIAYNVIQKHRGNISVQSRVGQGTTFLIELPVDGVKEG